MKLPDPQTCTLFEHLAARLESVIRAAGWKRSMVVPGRLNANTVRRVLQGKNVHVSTLMDIADALDCELVVDFKPKAHDTQDVAHEK